ncbi:MAG: hypothetical protein GX593_13960, partial [Actinomycetales bacterium]|nr:hypothetical protein [Actinomycetales bacterium]
MTVGLRNTGLRVLALTDTDSYLKWGAATLDTLPAEWPTRVLVLRSPAAPTPPQRATALAGTRFAGAGAGDVTLWTLGTALDEFSPDVLLVATTGPVADLVVRLARGRWGRRRRGRVPLIVTGLPGMSIPATELAVRLRAGADLFVTHSVRERRDFAALAGGLGLGMRVELARLPFLPGAGGGAVEEAGAVAPHGTAPAPSPSDTAFLAAAHPAPVRRVL